MTPESLFLYCRCGFEAECAAEIQERAAALGVSGYCKAKPDAGYVVFQTTASDSEQTLQQRIEFSSLIFARQWFAVLALRNDLPVADRVSALVESARLLPAAANDLCLETPDTNEGKQLLALCRAIERPLRTALERDGLLRRVGADSLRLHVCFLSTHAAYVGYAYQNNSAPWPLGIPRLRFPRGAPSRSTLKLEEAFQQFLAPDEQLGSLRPGVTAVDLGAAPGGWTWQLVQRGVHVTAVDNGGLDPQLAASDLVQHRREDGFRFVPATPVIWLVCDIVEQPVRVADLVARWFENRWCERAIFNLKLPMKKRYQEVQRCLALLQERLRAAGIGYRLACKQLFHDREEVTVYVVRV